MKALKWKAAGRFRCLAAALALVLALSAPGVQSLNALPDRLSLAPGSNALLEVALPVSARLDSGDTSASLAASGAGYALSAGTESGTANLIFRLLGVVPVKTVEVEVAEARRLIPGGQSVGIAIETQGLLVVGTSDLGQCASPARLAGLDSGDLIIRVDGNEVNTASELSGLLREGEPAAVTVVRDGEERTLTLTPAADPRDGRARIGAWVRSSTAGVGTLTFVDPQTGAFGALGHAISDVDTGIMLPVAEGGMYESAVVEVRRSERGAPGEIVGDFLTEEKQIGCVTRNCDCGVFGDNYTGDLADALYPDGLPVGARSQLHTGDAQILTTVDEYVQAYDCEIERLESESGAGTRSMVLHITDPALLARTGGIVQGMSGSPIIQDGRIIGAVTHVYLSDSTQGYGMYIEWMLEQSDGMASRQTAA